VVEQFHSLGENPMEREVDSRSDGFLYMLFQNGYSAYKCVDTADYILSLLIKERMSIMRSSFR
ncbi:hypothetical protein, partial [Gracilibacillus thailandensis]|uniref:hypothetical protein n=1 Tax=Gracilibacillus thailandensis TaxID=563735 RepID=UPI001969B56C